ncbi:MAG: hypothetical protein JWR19_2797 [Pedosphaera sp.]|nr:hypothetical protein [Pedosphaera sp.]
MKKSASRFWIVTAIGAGTALLCLALYWRGYEPLQKLEFYTQDLRTRYGKKSPIDPRLVLIGIDRASYASDFTEAEFQSSPALQPLRGNFPWSRTVWANLIQRLADSGAKVIVLDLIFAGQGEGDDVLKQVLEKYKDRVVIGGNFRDLKSDRGASLTLDLPNASVLNTASNSAAFDGRVGFVNIWTDWDGVLRHARYRLNGEQTSGVLPSGTMVESLAARALRAFGRPELIPNEAGPVRFRYTCAPGFGYKVHALGDVLLPKAWKQNYQDGEFFRGKIVLIGPTADIFQDTHPTPFPTIERAGQTYSSEMLGPEIHLNIIGAALNSEFLRETRLEEDLMIIVLAGLLASALSFFMPQPLRRLVVIPLLCIGYWSLGQFLFNRANLVIPVASPLLVLTVSGIFVLGYDYFLEQFERARVRKTLERYVSKDIVKELLDNPGTYFNTLGGVRKPVTILFSDVRGFTTLTEGSDSAQLVKQLNEYFEEMVRHVFGFQGTLDKFIGDAVMAVWGNFVTQGPERDAQHAVATALEMKRGLARLNINWKQRGLPELAFGIGINHGEVIVGNLGSAQKMELTVIGDAVNLASRLEGLTKKYHLDLIVGETVAPLVRERFVLRTVDFVQVKGKTKPVEIHTVVGERSEPQEPKETAWLKDYEEGIQLYRKRAFAEAARIFEACVREKPDDYLSGMYRQSCEALIKNAPDASWTGVSVMTDK